MDPDLLTPMIRKGNQDFYTLEPIILSDQTYCIPTRWFRRADVVFARAWRIHPVQRNKGDGWIVHAYDDFEVPASQMVVSFPYFCDSFHQRHLPDPRNIVGKY